MSSFFVTPPPGASALLRRLAIAVPAIAIVLALASLGSSPARADIYTWTDASGRVNISNLTPPDGVAVTRVYREDPDAAARAEAAREKARDAELRALAARVQQLEREVDLSAQRAALPPPVYSAPPAPPPIAYPYAAAPPAPAYAAPPPQNYSYGYGYGYGCDVTLFGCTTWWNPYPSTLFVPVAPYARYGALHRHRYGAHPSHPVAPGHRVQPGRPGYGGRPMVQGTLGARRG